METPKVDEQLDRTNGRWRNAVAIYDRQTKKWGTWLFPFKMLIFALKTYGLVVPLGFMYKHEHGFFVPVGAAAATLMTFKPMFSDLVKGRDPVDREKGRFLGTVSAAVVAMAYIQLHQWKWLPGIQGLFARLLCACMDEANAHRNFAASITGGVWLLGQLAGRAPWESLRCLQGCAEKCHGDYLCVLGQLVAELLPLYDTQLCGLLQEMKCKYCGDDGKFGTSYIKIVPSDHKTYPNLIKRLMGHGGRLTLAVTQMLFWCDDLVTAIKTYTYEHDGKPLLIVDAEPRCGQYPEHEYVVVRSKARQSRRTGDGKPAEDNWNLYTNRGPRGWYLNRGIGYPTHDLNVEKLKACADNPQNKWGSSFTGTLEQVNAQTPQQYEDLYEAVGVTETSFISIRQANEKVNGEDRILHSKELVIVAELLGPEGAKFVSECKEEMGKKTDDGRRFTVLTASCTYHGRLTAEVFIDAAHGKEELMKGQVAVVVLCFVFPDDVREVTYQRGSGRKYTVAPPRDRRLYCVLDGHLSEASREALISIDFPSSLLYWGLCRLHGIQLDDNWLEANPPHGNWTGTDELACAFRDGVCGPGDVRRKALEIGARSADKLQLASPCAFEVDELCAALVLDDAVDEALLAKVRDAVSGLGASVDDEGDAKMDDAPAPHDDADSMDDAPPAPADDLAPPADLDAARNVQGDGGAARENSASVPGAPPLGAPPNLGAVAGRPLPPARAFADLTPIFRALPNAPHKPQGLRGYRPQDDGDAPRHHFTFDDSSDSEDW